MPSATLAIPGQKPRQSLLRAVLRRLHLGVLALTAAGFAAPIALLSHGTDRARACHASYEAARGPDLPDCRHEIRWFVMPSRIPWTATAARYRAEEITMRHAVAAYADAAIGRPDGDALALAADGLFAANKVIRAGSQRATLDELGRAAGAPDPGRSAMLLGDRRTLIAKSDLWPHWSVRLATLEAALVEGDVDRARAIARRYAEFDPRDEDLRVALAAMLCLSGEGRRALDFLVTVQTARAKDRHEAWARNWGEARAAIVACAVKAGLPTPPLPERDGAGVNDHVDARVALRLRLLSSARQRDPFAVREASKGAIELLERGPMPKGARVRVLALLLGLGRTIEPDLAAVLAVPHTVEGEAPLVGHPVDLTAVEWIEQPRGLYPIASPEALRAGADALRRMAAMDETSADDRSKLVAAAAATSLEAARAFATTGDGASAVAALEPAAADLGPSAHLARSSAWYVTGDAARALEAIDEGRPPIPPGSADRASPPPEGDALGVVFRLQRAEILASLGRRDEAAREATAADDRAAALGDRVLDLRAQWTRLAIARSRRSSSPPPSLLALPWIGPLATPASWLDPAAESRDAVASALAFWEAARSASAADRRAMRYAIVEPHAGDAPRARASHLAIAADLLAPGEGDVEVWLDAVGATAARRGTLRAYAFARREAARLRGDLAAAARWAARFAALAKLAAPAEDAELCAVLGI